MPRTAEQMKTLWTNLASEEEKTASRALLALAATPKETVAFLQLYLRPVKLDPARVAQLLRDLDSPKFREREAAEEELEYLGKCAKPLLEKHLKDSPSEEAQRRLGNLLKRLPPDPVAAAPAKAPPPAAPPLQGRSVAVTNNNGQIKIVIDGQEFDLSNLQPAAPPAPPPGPPRPNLGWLRAGRAVLLLEHLATPEARQLLQTLAQGEDDAPPTKAAREALERLGK